MEIIFSGSWVGAEKGDPAFLIGTNFYGPFQIGIKAGADHLLLGEVLEGPEFVFDGRLFLPGGSAAGTIIDNFPKGPAPLGWTIRKRPDINGYDLVDSEKTIFGYSVSGTVCKVTVNLYAADGRLIAESLENDFRIYTNAFWAGAAVVGAP